MYCSYTGIRQIRLEIWPEPDLAGFPKNGQIPDLPEPEPKSGKTLDILFMICKVDRLLLLALPAIPPTLPYHFTCCFNWLPDD